MSKLHTLIFSREELKWLYKRVLNSVKHFDRIIKEGDANPPTSEAGIAQREKASNSLQGLSQLKINIETAFGEGMKELGDIHATREELEHQLALVEEPEIKQAIEARLARLKPQEDYRVSMDRASIKAMLEDCEKYIQSAKIKIPEYYKRPPEQFEERKTEDGKHEPVSRSLYINELTRGKQIAEQLAIRLEKRL